jgi:HEPN domain-containing protein
MTSGAPRPNTASLAEAREWLERAATDLLAASKLLRTRPPVPAIAVYHAQQTAEKALKAFLAAYNTPFRKTHDLEDVLRGCMALNPAFGQLHADARLLAPYAVRFRYPDTGTPAAPPLAEARAADLQRLGVTFSVTTHHAAPPRPTMSLEETQRDPQAFVAGFVETELAVQFAPELARRQRELLGQT